MILHSFAVDDVSVVESLQPGRYYLVAVADEFLLKVQTIAEADHSPRGETAMKGAPHVSRRVPDGLLSDPPLSELVELGLQNVIGRYGA